MRIGRFLGSIRVRMVVIYLLVTAAAFVAISVIVSNLMETHLVSQRTQQQSQQVERLALRVADAVAQGDPEKLYQAISARAQELGGRVLILDVDAVVQADSASQYNGFHLPYREVQDVLEGGKESAYGFHNIIRTASREKRDDFALLGSRTYRVWAVYYTAPIIRGGTVLGAVLFSTEIQDVEDSVSEMLNKISLIFLAMAVAISLISFLLSRWLTQPVLTLTNAIRRMGRQGSGARVNIKGRGELAELGEAFNRMSQQIENHDRLRDEFVSNASHELKTPLSAMKVLSESILYQDDPDPAMMKEFFRDINHEVDRLTGVINDLLRLVREDAAEMELNFVPVALDELTRRVVTRLTPLAREKGIRMEMRLSPVTLKGDESRLEQVIINLVDNAIKYTDEGSVQVSVREETGEAVLTVKDTGIGIPKEVQPRLFERFYRVDKARSRGTGGTGLGLSIVEKIVLHHGGYIQVDSAPGKGSAFTVVLPLMLGGEGA